MSLTIGNAPFGSRPGAFNFTRVGPERALYLEDSPRWVRATFAGETIVSSKHPKLLHETELLPVYYFRREDVRMDLLVPTDHHTRCPLKGEASYWSIDVGGKRAENAAWSYPEPIEGAEPLRDLMAFYWNALDHWYEEDEEVFVHARDPYHRIDIVPSARRVEISLHGHLLAETTRPRILFETGLPPRFYVPRGDVRMELLRESATLTRCPYKGTATYWSVSPEAEDRDGAEDLVWCYEDPIPEAAGVKGLLAFFNERVDLEVDGELQERPKTKWSR